MKKGQKRIKTEYKILIIVICVCIVILVGLYLYKKYYSVELDTNDYKNCTIEEHSRYQMNTCKIMDEDKEIIHLSYPILKEENCKDCRSINQEILRTFEEEWNKIKLVRVENEGLEASVDAKTEYLVNENDGILSILKATYEFYPNKHITSVRDYFVSQTGSKMTRDEVLNLLNYNLENTNHLVQETMRKIYFIDYRYDYLSEPDQFDEIRTMLLHFEVSNLDAMYFDNQKELMAIKKVPHPRIRNSLKTYYINLRKNETGEWYPFESESEKMG